MQTAPKTIPETNDSLNGNSEIKRFLEKINKQGPVPEHVPDLGKCWTWSAGTFPNGYGQFRGTNRKTVAHRFSFEIHRGKIPDGILVLHKCDNRRCVNPDHLFLGSHFENTADMISKGRRIQGASNPQRGKDHWTNRNPGKVKNGERHNMHKLTDGDVKWIIKNRIAMTVASIASKLNVSVGAIYLIINNKTWRHIQRNP